MAAAGSGSGSGSGCGLAQLAEALGSSEQALRLILSILMGARN